MGQELVAGVTWGLSVAVAFLQDLCRGVVAASIAARRRLIRWVALSLHPPYESSVERGVPADREVSLTGLRPASAIEKDSR